MFSIQYIQTFIHVAYLSTVIILTPHDTGRRDRRCHRRPQRRIRRGQDCQPGIHISLIQGFYP